MPSRFGQQEEAYTSLLKFGVYLYLLQLHEFQLESHRFHRACATHPRAGVEIPAFAPCSTETEDQNWDLVLEK